MSEPDCHAQALLHSDMNVDNASVILPHLRPFTLIFPINLTCSLRLHDGEEPLVIPAGWCAKFTDEVLHAGGGNAHTVGKYRAQLKFSTCLLDFGSMDGLDVFHGL